MFSEADIATFWAQVDKNGPVPAHRPDLGPCWLWTGGHSAGYGSFRRRTAHNVAWEIEHGTRLNGGVEACHHCDVRPCVRPAHLFAGTRADNMKDCVAKGRKERGEAVATARLTVAQVAEIRSRPEDSQRVLAREFGVSQTAVWDVLHGRTWSWSS